MTLSPLRGVKFIIEEALAVDLVAAGKSAFIKWAESLTEKDVKDFNKCDLNKEIDDIKETFTIAITKEEAAKFMQNNKLLISTKLLQSASLEKRINGITDIKKMVEKAVTESECDHLMHWIIEHNIISLILDVNTHSEVIKRSSAIFSFLAKRNAITKEILEQLWKCQQEKHEDIVRVIYESIKEMIKFLSLENINLLYEKINTLPLDKCNEILILFMKDFTSRAIARHRMFSTKFEVDMDEPPDEVTRLNSETLSAPNDEKLYFIKNFWNLIKDETPISQTLFACALKCLEELLVSNTEHKYKMQYLYLCMKNLKEHKSVPQSLELAKLILEHTSEGFLGEVIAKLIKDYDVVNLLLSDCETYERLVTDFLSTNKNDSKISELVIVGNHNHLYNLIQRFGFLRTLLMNGGRELNLGESNIIRMCNLYIENSACKFDTQVFLNCFSLDHKTSINLLTHEEAQLLLDIIFKHRPELQNSFPAYYYSCFASLFILINFAAKSIKAYQYSVKVYEFRRIFNIDKLWDCVKYAEVEMSRAPFSELLISLYTNFDTTIEEVEKEKLAHDFVDKCIQSISKEENDKVIFNVVKLLLMLFGFANNENPEMEECSIRTYNIEVGTSSTSDTKTIYVNLNMTIHQVKRKVAKLFRIPLTSFELVTSSGALDADDDNESVTRFLTSLGSKNRIWIHKFIDTNKTAAAYLAQNQAYVHTLFALLSKQNAEYVDCIWNLLTSMPPNKEVQDGLEAMELTEDGWNNLLDSRSTYKFLYSLQIIEGMINSINEIKTTSNIDGKWLIKFCEKGGLNHLFESLINLPTDNMENPLIKKCFALLIKVLHEIQSFEFDLEQCVKDYVEKQDKMIERVMLVLDSFAQSSIPAEGTPAAGTRKSKESKDTAEEQKNREKEAAGKVFSDAFTLMRSTDRCSHYESMVKYINFKRFLLNGLVLGDNEYIKSVISKEVLKIQDAFRGKEYDLSNPCVVLIPYMLQTLVKETLTRNSNCEKFYSTLNLVISYSSVKVELSKLPISLKEEIDIIAGYIKQHKKKEANAFDIDQVIVGLMNLLDELLKKYPEEIANICNKYEMLHDIINKSLFEFPDGISQMNEPQPRCKSTSARTAAFNLVLTLCRDFPKNIKQVLDYLMPIHVNASWRTKRMIDWCIMPESDEKSSTGYVGLKNLGAICYMNSLLQQFFMIPTFRNAVLSVKAKTDINPNENFLHQIQCLFSALKLSTKQYYNPKPFCGSLKDWENKPISPYEQMDVDEFFNLFLDRLEVSLKGSPQENTIKQHFEGLFANQLLCRDCPHYSIRDEPFLALNLQVKNKKSLQQCLESFVEGEMLQGENAYYCDKCDKRVTTLKRTCIKRLPRHLIFVLKRFGMNFDTMQKFKINDYCEFPMKINMKNYTEEGLAEKEEEKDKAEGETGSSTKRKHKNYPTEYYEYKLAGVVIHLGTSDMGHYYSLIMDREKNNVSEKDRWYEFNDTQVDKYNLKELKEDAFGYEEQMEGSSWRSVGRIKNAYLLFYERVSSYIPPKDEEEESNEKVKLDFVTEMILPYEIHKEIVAENLKYWYNKLIFQQIYFEFVPNLVQNWNSRENIFKDYPCRNIDFHLIGMKKEEIKEYAYSPNANIAIDDELQNSAVIAEEDSWNTSLAIGKYLLTVFLTTLIRSKHSNLVPIYIDLAKAYLNKHIELSKWFIRQLTNERLMAEFLLECPEEYIRRIVVGLLYCSMLNVYREEKLFIENGNVDNSLLLNLAHGWFHQLTYCKEFERNITQFFQVLSRLAFLGPEIRRCLLKENLLQRLLEFATTEKPPQCEDLKWTENAKPELGLPPVEDKHSQRKDEYRGMYRFHDEACYTFLIEAITLLIRAVGELKVIEEERSVSSKLFECISSFLLYPESLRKLIIISKNTLAIVELSKVLGDIFRDRIEVRPILLEAILYDLLTRRIDNMQFIFCSFKYILSHGSQEIAASFNENYIKLMKRHSKVAFKMLNFVQVLVFTVQQFPILYRWYRENEETWIWVLQWLESYAETAMKGDADEESMSYEYDSSKTMHVHNIHNVIAIFNKIKNGQEPIEKDGQEDLVTCYYDKFCKNQVVEHASIRTQRWDQWVIRQVIDEMIYVEPKFGSESLSEWVEVESNYLAKLGTHTTVNESRNNNEDVD